MSTTALSLHLLTHPYRTLHRVNGSRTELKAAARRPGSGLVWRMEAKTAREALVEGRPGGLALIVILPKAEDISEDPEFLQALNGCRPQGILPHHWNPVPHDLAQVLRRPPVDLAAEVTDYLAWRGLVVDRDTTHLIRRILDHSAELRSVTALSRSMYLSRRALGRRLLSRGLPVPSHWLQLGRILRLAIRLQNSRASVFSIACEAGYPDGFSVSNQMQRLVGYRPSQVREFLGWEWLLEEWLRREARGGGLAPVMAQAVNEGPRANSDAVPPRAKIGRPLTKSDHAATEPREWDHRK